MAHLSAESIEALALVLPEELHRRGLCSCPEEESYACSDATEYRIRQALQDVAAELAAEEPT